MEALRVWKRLLWKEFREGRFVLLAAILAPPVLFPLALNFPDGSWQRAMLGFPAAGGVHIAIALWAAGKGNSKRQAAEYTAAHLPVHPLAEWVSSLLIPAITLAVAGLWFGFWTTTSANSETMTIALLGALDLTATYVVCYLIAMVISNWAAIIFGAFRLIGGTVLTVWGLTPAVDPGASGFGQTVTFVASTAAGAIVGSFLFAAMSQKRSIGFRQIISLLVMLIIAFGPSARTLGLGDFLPEKQSNYLSGGEAVSEDGTLMVFTSYLKHNGILEVSRSDDRNERRDQVVFEMASPRYGIWPQPDAPRKKVHLIQGKPRVHKVSLETQVLGLAGRSVYLAQQRSKDQRVKILEWDAVTNAITEKAAIPAQGDVLTEPDYRPSNVSPDGRYVLKWLKSMRGHGYDLWGVDLQTGRSGVVLFCRAQVGASTVQWIKHKAIMFGGLTPLEVDLRTMTVRPFRITMRGEKR